MSDTNAHQTTEQAVKPKTLADAITTGTTGTIDGKQVYEVAYLVRQGVPFAEASKMTAQYRLAYSITFMELDEHDVESINRAVDSSLGHCHVAGHALEAVVQALGVTLERITVPADEMEEMGILPQLLADLPAEMRRAA